jgi:hypothetical protein
MPEISSSWTRNPPEERLFRRERLAQGQGIHRINGIPQGNISSSKRNPPKEANFIKKTLTPKTSLKQKTTAKSRDTIS